MRGIDYFAGAGGWDVAAAHWLGWEVTGHEIMLDARLTRSAFGLKTSEINDVREVEAERGQADVHLASPPCQPFSPAGLGAGRRALDAVLAVVKSYHDGRPMTYAEASALTGDERTALVVEPLRLALQGRPPFIAWEQVPAVLPVWRACAHVLERGGYSTAVGLLDAERYGVPQTRKRAILVARRDGAPAVLPTPTHSRYYSRTPERIDEGVLPWVSMAEALGWNDGEAFVGFPRLADRAASIEIDGVRYRARDLRSAGAPAFALTEKARSWQVFPQARWMTGAGATGAGTPRPDTDPAPTQTAKGTAAWLTDPALYRDPQWKEKGGVLSRRVSISEAATLQTFPPDYPWSGTQTKQFLQVGNAVPPLLAYAILSTFVTRSAAPERIEPEQLALFSGWAMAA